MTTVTTDRNKNRLARIVSLLLVLALLAGALPQQALAAPIAATAAAAAVTCASKYTVVSGDTLSKIAAQYNLTVTELANANSLTEPYTLFVGQSLCIPSTSSSGTTTTTTTTNTKGLTIEIKGTTLVVKAAGLAKKTVYIIKVKRAGRGTYTWTKVGRMKTDKLGAGTMSVKLPKNLRDMEYMTICAKNAINDTIVCTNWTP